MNPFYVLIEKGKGEDMEGRGSKIIDSSTSMRVIKESMERFKKKYPRRKARIARITGLINKRGVKLLVYQSNGDFGFVGARFCKRGSLPLFFFLNSSTNQCSSLRA